nr:hypothetical protein [Mucilaginibacter sp. L294]
MTKKIILGIVFVFLVMGGVTFWIFNSFDRANAESGARTEADFTTQKFTVKELWEMQNKKNDQVLMSYLYIKVENEPINLRLPWEGSSSDQATIAGKINNGDQIEVKVLRSQLAAARENGPLKAIGRFIMGDKREVTIFKLQVKNEVLVDKDIHGWDDAKVTLLSRMTSNPWILLIPAFILFYIIGLVKRKNAKKGAA